MQAHKDAVVLTIELTNDIILRYTRNLFTFYYAEFDRDYYGEDLYFHIEKKVLDNITNINDLIKALLNDTLIKLMKDCVELDKTFYNLENSTLYEFIPDEAEPWYVVQDGQGISGEQVVKLYPEYKANKDTKKALIRQLLCMKDEAELSRIEIVVADGEEENFNAEFEGELFIKNINTMKTEFIHRIFNVQHHYQTDSADCLEYFEHPLKNQLSWLPNDCV